MCAALSFVQNDGERQNVLNVKRCIFFRQYTARFTVVLNEQQRGRGEILLSSSNSLSLIVKTDICPV